MPIESTNNIVFDFLAEPRFRIGRHALLLVMVIGYTIGSSMYVFENHTGELGLVSYVYTVSLAVMSVGKALQNGKNVAVTVKTAFPIG